MNIHGIMYKVIKTSTYSTGVFLANLTATSSKVCALKALLMKDSSMSELSYRQTRKTKKYRSNHIRRCHWLYSVVIAAIIYIHYPSTDCMRLQTREGYFGACQPFWGPYKNTDNRWKVYSPYLYMPTYSLTVS